MLSWVFFTVGSELPPPDVENLSSTSFTRYYSPRAATVRCKLGMFGDEFRTRDLWKKRFRLFCSFSSPGTGVAERSVPPPLGGSNAWTWWGRPHRYIVSGRRDAVSLDLISLRKLG